MSTNFLQTYQSPLDKDLFCTDMQHMIFNQYQLFDKSSKAKFMLENGNKKLSNSRSNTIERSQAVLNVINKLHCLDFLLEPISRVDCVKSFLEEDRHPIQERFPSRLSPKILPKMVSQMYERRSPQFCSKPKHQNKFLLENEVTRNMIVKQRNMIMQKVNIKQIEQFSPIRKTSKNQQVKSNQ